jgi:hypothetical protein
MSIQPGDGIRIQFRGRCFGQRIVMDLSYRTTIGNNAISTREGLQAINATVGNLGAGSPLQAYLACLPPQYLLDEVRSQVVWPIRSAYEEQGFGPGQTGTHGSPATVACDSAAVTRRTAFSGRNQISTLKVGPCPDGASAAGLITDAYRVLLATFAGSTLVTFIAGATQIRLVPTILGAGGAVGTRDLESQRVGLASRVMHRRVVGIGE